ncbi:MFS transporter [Paenarthrobacter aurescens]|nr:MFS transporter [Paenarthrobacter aurescens]MDO6147276.1 MFS transporter [Paenarthrobacter aurescens]MDO6158520.1 MFS transporter [Paenarthrobacter aurescens]MDO6162503.1 MFS transporter [Paenarthrobacter aurescens]
MMASPAARQQKISPSAPATLRSIISRGRPGRTEPAPQLLLASQLIFNIGFYAVVPFLAVAMRNDFGMGALAIGVVLGARTFAQQGMFLFGGALADRWGARRSMITGCIVRITGFLLLVWAADFPLFLIGAIVTGIGGALFSPALQSLVGAAAERGSAKESASSAGGGTNDASTKSDKVHNSRSSLFALLVICGEVGVVVGPLLGSFLLNTGFDTALLTGAGVFAIMAVVFWLFLPKNRPDPKASAVLHSAVAEPSTVPSAGLWSCLRDRKFLGFAAFYSVNLLATHQLYFGLPVELERSGAGVTSLALVFTYASILTITLQWPIAGLMRRAGPRIALPLGFALQALGFASLGVLATLPPAGWLPILPALVLVTGTALGNMCVQPVTMGLVLEFASGRPTGAYYGLLASAGGLAVVLGNTALAPLYELAYAPSATAFAPWIFLSALGAMTATFIRRFLPHSSAQAARPAGQPD